MQYRVGTLRESLKLPNLAEKRHNYYCEGGQDELDQHKSEAEA